MDWADWAGHHAAAAWIGHSLAISAKHYVRVRGDHFEKVTGRLVHNAIHDALTTQFTTQHVPAPTCNNPQQMLRGPVKGRVVHLGADPCGYMLETSMGDTGLELTVKSSCDLSVSEEGNANPNAPGQALGGNKSGLGQDVILAALLAGSGVQPELIAIVKALLRLDPQALRAFGAIISVLRDSTPTTPEK